MKLFLHAHATHPDWRMALALAAARSKRSATRRARAGAPTLGWLYLTDHYAGDAEALLDALRRRWPGVTGSAPSGVGIAASGVEYFDEPALALMLGDLPPAHFSVFSGARRRWPRRRLRARHRAGARRPGDAATSPS